MAHKIVYLLEAHLIYNDKVVMDEPSLFDTYHYNILLPEVYGNLTAATNAARNETITDRIKNQPNGWDIKIVENVRLVEGFWFKKSIGKLDDPSSTTLRGFILREFEAMPADENLAKFMPKGYRIGIFAIPVPVVE